MKVHTKTIRTSTSELRKVFRNWLLNEYQSEARLIVLEGLFDSGKTRLTRRRFKIGGARSLNISIDQFLPSTELKADYAEEINRCSLQAGVRTALASMAPLVVIEGPMTWPLIKPIAKIAPGHIRRVYLKRMMRCNPEVWVDEEVLKNPNRWDPGGVSPLDLPVPCRMQAVG
jgi:hypothetical protein